MGRRTPGGEPSGKTYVCLIHFLKNVIFRIQTEFFYGFNMLMSFLAQK